MTTILLLCLSNVFMTFAWYGHLKYKHVWLPWVILASWGIAFVEYCFAVPANRIGHGVYTAAQLKTIQEVVTLVVFAAFSVLYLNEPLIAARRAAEADPLVAGDERGRFERTAR